MNERGYDLLTHRRGNHFTEDVYVSQMTSLASDAEVPTSKIPLLPSVLIIASSIIIRCTPETLITLNRENILSDVKTAE